MTTANILSPRRPSLRMTEEEFVRWSLGNKSAEWVNGEVFSKMSVTGAHDELQFFIRSVVQHIVERRQLGKVRGPEFTTRLNLASKVVRRDPDLMFIAEANVGRLHLHHLEGPADLVVEIISPESEFRDFNEKFHEYEEGGVPEYWIVSPLASVIHLFVRGANGKFVRRKRGKDKRFRSTVIEGLWFDSEVLFAPNRPNLFEFLTRIDSELPTR